MSDKVQEPLAAWPVPPRVLPRHTWEDYARWEGDWELIRGVPFPMSPAASIRHHDALAALFLLLQNGLADDVRWHAFVEMDWIADTHTTIRPDVMVAREPVGEDWVRRPPVLVAEVLSPSTAAKDRIEKRALCAEHQVRYFLLVDPDTRTVEAFAWQDGDYHPLPTEPTLTLDFEGSSVSIPVAALFARPGAG
jgi:Uma2 family endonuclease